MITTRKHLNMEIMYKAKDLKRSKKLNINSYPNVGADFEVPLEIEVPKFSGDKTDNQHSIIVDAVWLKEACEKAIKLKGI